MKLHILCVEIGMFLRNCLAFVFVLTCVTANAQTAIESVSGTVQGGAEVVRIDLSQVLTALPTGFTIQSPARIALDFPGVSNSMGRSTVEVNQGNLRSVSVVQAGERTRVVLNLRQATSYKAEIQGKSLLVALEPLSVNQSLPAKSNPTFAENRSRDSAPLKDIDFRRTADGSGRIVVNLPNNQVGVDIRQQGQGLVVEFMKSTLPEGLRRRLVVGDFGTPVRTVTTSQVGDRVRMVIEPNGLWEHSAYQSDEQFVVEVKEVKTDPRKLTQGIGYNGQKLSLNFQNIEVRSLLQVIADFTNFNIVTSDSVAGSVTLRLQDVPWDQALDIILQSKNLGMRKNGNVIWVAPKDEIAAKEKLDFEASASVQNLEPLRTQSFQINYGKASDIAAQLAAGGSTLSASGVSTSARILSPRGSVIAEQRTNQLFVTDIPSKLEQVQQLIAKLDIAVRQVLIEARIVEASDGFLKSLGVKLGATDQRASRGGDGGYLISGDTRVAIGTSYGNAIATSGGGGSLNTAGTFVNLPANGGAFGEAASIGASIFSAAANRYLNLEIQALEGDNKGKIVSSPRVVTANQQQAIIEAGVQIPYVGATGGTATQTVTFKDATLKLDVTPQITPEGAIILSLEITKDSQGQNTSAGPVINKNRIKTQVLVENGGTVVIGGIYTMLENIVEAKVPFFGDLPGLGYLFKNKSTEVKKSELLVFITPKTLSDSNVR
jgi:type IV pilus assembly protein PilQ